MNEDRDRVDGTARVSVVIASQGNESELVSWLGSLRWGRTPEQGEVVVVRAGDLGDAASAALLHRGARFVSCPADATVMELRAAGMRAAIGDIVALIDDVHMVQPGWLETLARGARAKRISHVQRGGAPGERNSE